jgi:hypothetical protein
MTNGAKRTLLSAALLLTACPGASSNFYRPSTSDEQDVLSRSRRDVFPDDIRRDIDAYRSTLVVWTGIVESARWLDSDHATAELRIEHHYWDFIEDLSIQREVAFLSARGEGPFSCTKGAGDAKPRSPDLPPAQSMAIVYGYPEAVHADSRVVDLRCTFVSIAPREWYATDIWDYGRNYLLHQEPSDFKILRVPY